MNDSENTAWLHELLAEVQLENFYSKLHSDLQVTRLSHFDYVKTEDLERVGMSKPAIRRLQEAVKKRKNRGKKGLLDKIFERGGESSGKPSSGPYTALLSGGSSSSCPSTAEANVMSHSYFGAKASDGKLHHGGEKEKVNEAFADDVFGSATGIDHHGDRGEAKGHHGDSHGRPGNENAVNKTKPFTGAAVHSADEHKKSDSSTKLSAADLDFFEKHFADRSGRSESPVPTLPPKDYLLKKAAASDGHSQQQHRPPPHDPKSSRILPVVQDGQQLSNTHYFLLPQPGDRSAKSSGTADYTNVALAPHPRARHLQVKTQEPTRPKSIADLAHLKQTAGVGGQSLALSKSATSLTSQQLDTVSIMTDTTSVDDYYDNDEVCFQSDDEDIASLSSASLSMSSVRVKIDEVRREVHGVTEEQCQAALVTHSWDAAHAIRYLKVEQMFRMGVATRDKCQRLLQEYGWNLELACSVLLEQYRSGSAA